jgi:hypothetical protein
VQRGVEPVGEPVAEVTEAGGVEAAFESMETGFEAELDVEPQPASIIDTTAEMLARASGKGKRPARSARPATPRKAAAKKPPVTSGRRAPRTRKGQTPAEP